MSFFSVTLFLFLLTSLTGGIVAQDQIIIDGNDADWANIPVLITDPNELQGQFSKQQNILWSDAVDVKEVKFRMDGTDVYWLIRFWGSAAWPNNPDGASSRGHYGLLIDLDNNANTGWNTTHYEGQETVLGARMKNIGAELYLEIGLDTDERAISYARGKLYYGGDFSEMTYHLPARKNWGKETIIFEVPPRDDKSGTFDPELMSGIYTDPASGGQFAHAWGGDFVEVRQSLDPVIAYWQCKGQEFLKPGDRISIAAHVETILDDWGDDFTDGAIYQIPDFTRTTGSVCGTVKKTENEAIFDGLPLEIKRAEQTVGMVTTDQNGRYFMALLPGDYSLKPAWGSVSTSAETTSFTIKGGQQTVLDFSVAKPEVPDILLQTVRTYQTLSSYRDTTTIFSHYIRPGMDSRSYVPLFFAFERPNRIRCEVQLEGIMADMMSDVYCNGKSLLLYKNKTREYTEKPAPSTLSISELNEALMGFLMDLSVPKLILSENPLDTLMKDVQQINVHPSKEVNGIPVVLVELIKPSGSFPGAVRHRLARNDLPVSVKIWIGSQDQLIHKMSYTLDLGKMADETPQATRDRFSGTQVTRTEIHSAIEVDASFSADLFTFLPPRRAKLVEHFKNPMDNQMRLSVFHGKPAPPFSLKDINDKDVGLAEFKGKVSIVNFWATWCGPCRVEIPTFIALHKQYADKGFTMIGISVDQGPEVVVDYVRENKVNYPMLMADDAVRASYGGIQAVPSSFVIDKKGIIRFTHLGVPGDQLTFQRQVEQLLAE